MMYKIKPEYLELWGADATEETFLNEAEVESIARGWDKDIDEVIDQLEPYNYRAAVELMDDEIREELHAEITPCSDARFLWEYCKQHYAKYGKPFRI